MFRLIYFRLYLPFLLNMVYVLYCNLFTLSLNIFSMLYQAFIYMIGYVRVGHVANLCVTHLGMMHLTSTCEMRGS
jgi:hypothetical protein